MLQFLISTLPIAFVWSAITGRVTLDSLVLGYVLGLITLSVLHRLGIRFEKIRSLGQILAALVYAGTVLLSALKSSLKIVKLVLSPEIKLETGIIALQTGDLSESQVLTALSAHGINSTPGEMVVDIADGGVLYVHCLDLKASEAVIEEEQVQRLQLLRRILESVNMNEVLDFVVNAALIILVVALGFSTYRIWTGPSALERLQALDLTTTILVGIIVVLGIVLDNSQIIDIGVALAAFSFVTTLAIARFVSEGRFF